MVAHDSVRELERKVSLMRRLVLLTAATALAVGVLAPAAAADSGSDTGSGNWGDGSALHLLPGAILFFPWAGSSMAMGCPLSSGSGVAGVPAPERPEYCKWLDRLYSGSG
ncbi:hypothetical protein [Nocardia huaxiensis]|nr:hypothetical protein [Nocardia huaxiensis]UFS93961.1 hypothetical protein LPY97_24635 [Nocardia huaxiensis]